MGFGILSTRAERPAIVVFGGPIPKPGAEGGGGGPPGAVGNGGGGGGGPPEAIGNGGGGGGGPPDIVGNGGGGGTPVPIGNGGGGGTPVSKGKGGRRTIASSFDFSELIKLELTNGMFVTGGGMLKRFRSIGLV